MITGSGYSFVIDDIALGNGPEFMVQWGTGYVGIGTTNPGTSLEVNGGIRAHGGTPGASGLNNNGYAFNGNNGDTDSGMFSSANGQVEFYNARRSVLERLGRDLDAEADRKTAARLAVGG